MLNKSTSRIRRAGRGRAKIREVNAYRLCVHRSSNHIYAQLLAPTGGNVLAAASSLEKDVKSKLKHGGNKEAASLVGELIGKRAIKAGIKKVAFDRAGYRYHGRVKALADAARQAGLEF